MSRVAVVTGSNKGIGFAIVELLCKNHPNWRVYLTSRDIGRGQEAVSKLAAKGLKPAFHQLDISDKASVEKLRDDLVKDHGGLDVLVNNAAIAYKQAATEPFAEQAEVTCKINYFDLWNTCDVLFPILKPHARVVHVSSRASSMTLVKLSQALRDKFCSSQLSRSELDSLMKQFVQSAKQGKHEAIGWVSSAYGVSKVGVTSMTVIQQLSFDKDPRADILVNACCPGYVVTDMTSGKGNKSPIEGADTPYYLATLSEGGDAPRGKFFAERKELEWAANMKFVFNL